MFGLGHQDTYHVNYQHEGGFDVASSARRCARRSPTCLSSMRKADAEQTGGADADYSDLASAAQTGGADADCPDLASAAQRRKRRRLIMSERGHQPAKRRCRPAQPSP